MKEAKDVILSKFTSGREKGIQKVCIVFYTPLDILYQCLIVEAFEFSEKKDPVNGI